MPLKSWKHNVIFAKLSVTFLVSIASLPDSALPSLFDDTLITNTSEDTASTNIYPTMNKTEARSGNKDDTVDAFMVVVDNIKPEEEDGEMETERTQVCSDDTRTALHACSDEAANELSIPVCSIKTEPDILIHVNLKCVL